EWVLQALADAQADMRLSTHPRLTLEVALARASNLEVRETQTVVARLERLERALLHGATSAPVAPVAAVAAVAAPEPVAASAPAPAPKKAVASKAPAPAPPKPAPVARVDGALSQQWDAVLEAVRVQSRVTHTHLREGWAVEVDEERLLVGFEKDFHAEQLRKRPEHVERITTVLGQVFGRKLRFETSVGQRPESGGVSSGEAVVGQSPIDLVRTGLGAEVVEEVSHS